MSEKIVQLNEEIIKGQIKELVRGSVEETLNELLEKEAESLTQAARYERSEARQGYRSGHYDRNLTTTSGDVTLHVPRLKGVSFETAIIERYRRRESSVEEALIEMYLAGVSVRRVEDITEALWGSKVSPATISSLMVAGGSIALRPVALTHTGKCAERVLSVISRSLHRSAVISPHAQSRGQFQVGHRQQGRLFSPPEAAGLPRPLLL